MILKASKMAGVYLIEAEPHRDDRGVFCELYNKAKLAENGIFFPVEQVNVSVSHRAGTVRGLHYQEEPYGQQKLVRCLSGEILDVIVDLRPESRTYRKNVWFKLSGDSFTSVLVPVGCAHGYQALKDFSELQYLVSAPWKKEAERGVQPEDPAVGIRWMLPVTGLNQRDASWPLLA
jgi:dTDP-4-dehydrorhamnose 3,5-epimerase